MSQLRHDALSGRDVILAEGRAARPFTVAQHDAAAVPEPPTCPFCTGSEGETPPEVARVGSGEPDAPGWRIRVVPNLYPIVGGADASSGTTGVHEVVVLSPDHERSFAQLSDADAVRVVALWQERARVHLADGHAYAFAIVKHLRAAGASIAHPPAQLFALDAVPPAVLDARTRWRAAATDLVVEDAADADLLVVDAGARVWCPPASPQAYTVRVAHPDAGPAFVDADHDVLAETARALRDALARLRDALDDPAYNAVVRTAAPGDHDFHWYVDVVPRLGVAAGFEMATGVLVNPVPPAAAACRLRDATA